MMMVNEYNKLVCANFSFPIFQDGGTMDMVSSVWVNNVYIEQDSPLDDTQDAWAFIATCAGRY